MRKLVCGAAAKEYQRMEQESWIRKLGSGRSSQVREKDEQPVVRRYNGILVALYKFLHYVSDGVIKYHHSVIRFSSHRLLLERIGWDYKGAAT